MPVKTLDYADVEIGTVSLGSYGEKKDPIGAKILSDIVEGEVGLLTGGDDGGKTLPTDSFDFVKVDPNDYEDYRDNKFLISTDFEGDVKVRVDELGIVMSGGSTMYEGIVMSGGSTMYEGLTDRIADEKGYGDEGLFDFKGDLLGDDF